ncbi:Asp-tRNA(Asn)/Glu-tRNA(Gln) amidotransferase subunit GatC [Myxococcota bacterium]
MGDIDQREVERIARLARLTLTEEEKATLASDLGAILEYVRKLEELDTTDVEATSHAVELPTKWREDEPGEGLPVELGLRGAPERQGDAFGVPKVIE